MLASHLLRYTFNQSDTYYIKCSCNINKNAHAWKCMHYFVTFVIDNQTACWWERIGQHPVRAACCPIGHLLAASISFNLCIGHMRLNRLEVFVLSQVANLPSGEIECVFQLPYAVLESSDIWPAGVRHLEWDYSRSGYGTDSRAMTGRAGNEVLHLVASAQQIFYITASPLAMSPSLTSVEFNLILKLL